MKTIILISLAFLFTDISHASTSNHNKISKIEKDKIKNNNEAKLNKAIALFKSGNLLEARQLLLDSRVDNHQSEKLYYNLGVINYKLGFYPSAKEAFLTLKDSNKLKTISYYNLGLIEIKLQNHAEASKWLDMASNSFAPEHRSIRTLAIKLKARIDNKSSSQGSVAFIPKETNRHGQKRSKYRNRIKSYIKTQTGYNDNIAQFKIPNSNNNYKINDTFLVFQADTAIQIFKTFRGSLSLNQLNYQNRKSFDTSTLTSELAYRNAISSWHYMASGKFTKQLVDTNDFQDIYSIKTKIKKNVLKNLSYHAFLSQDTFSINNDTYLHHAGSRRIISNGIKFSRKKASYSLDYQYETNNRNDFYSNGRFNSSFSPKIHRLNTKVTLRPTNSLYIELEGQTFFSQFSGEDYINPNFSRKRIDVNVELGVKTSYLITKNIFLVLNYEYINNDSVLSRYKYINNTYQGGISWKI